MQNLFKQWLCVQVYTLVEADIGTLHSVYLCISHTQLAAYLNFFECSGTVELKKKNPS